MARRKTTGRKGSGPGTSRAPTNEVKKKGELPVRDAAEQELPSRERAAGLEPVHETDLGENEPSCPGRAVKVEGDMPLFEEPDGGTVGAWQRREMLVAVLHPAGCERCDAVRALLDTERDTIEAADAAVVRFTAGDPGYDPHGRWSKAIARALGDVPLPALIAADRYARLLAAEDLHAADPAAALRDALDWIDYAQLRCEECGPPLDWR